MASCISNGCCEKDCGKYGEEIHDACETSKSSNSKSIQQDISYWILKIQSLLTNEWDK